MKNRISKHFELSSQLASMDDNQIQKLLKGVEVGKGWGTNHVANVSGNKIFVKSLSLTELERKNAFSTKNLFNLPLYYNYGVGSAGMGAFRELNLHVKTTNWVLTGEIDSFPLMHHFRIVKKSSKIKKMSLLENKKHTDYIKYWNSSKKIDHYIMERKASEYEIIIFLEYVPFVFRNWLKPNISKINELSKKLFAAFDFLSSKGVIHFDAHLGNILTDGKNVFLTDFGLALDDNFNLTKKEKIFYKNHKSYDHMEFIGCMSLFLESFWHDLNTKQKKQLEDQFQIKIETPYFEKISIILENLDSISKIMKLNKTYVKFLSKHIDIIKLSNNFFFSLRKDPKKRVVYPSKLVTKSLNRTMKSM